MKKVGALLVFSLFCMNTNIQAAEEIQENTSYMQEFFEGFAAGAFACAGIDLLRNRVFPNIDSWQLHANTGICRDQLTGEVKVVAALIGAAAFNKAHASAGFKKLSARTFGILVGICAANFITK